MHVFDEPFETVGYLDIIVNVNQKIYLPSIFRIQGTCNVKLNTYRYLQVTIIFIHF